jgi:hypothetical protein
MLRRVLVSGSMLLVCATAPACDLDIWGASEHVAQYDYSWMTEEEKAEAQKQALQEFHEIKMAQAKAAFLNRFKIKPDPSPDNSSKTQLKQEEPEAKAEPEGETTAGRPEEAKR